MPVKLKRGIQEWNAALHMRTAQIAQANRTSPTRWEVEDYSARKALILRK
jgi:hypothetical protein